jgi:hypothetical protein
VTQNRPLNSLKSVTEQTCGGSLKELQISSLRVEDRLAGAGNWFPWKARIVLILEEGKLWYIV